MKKQALLNLIALGEGFTTEFKQSGTSNLGQEICAFANATGGVILIGVTDGGEIVGVDDHNRLKSKVQAIARSTANVQVYIFKDRVEIVSPGGLPAGMTEADLGIKSIPRNPLLFGMLHRMEAVEHIGSGIKRIRNLCREYGVAEPRIEVSEHWFSVIFPRPANGIKVGRQQPDLQPESQPESRPELQPKSMDFRILSLLAKDTFSKAQLSAALGQKTVSGHLNKVVRRLLVDGFIELTIPAKPASRLQEYRITPKGRTMLENHKEEA